MPSNKLPITGTTITMGRVRNAFNLAGQVSLNSTLGSNRRNERAGDGGDDADSTPASATTALSGSFGNRPTKGPAY